MDISLDRFASPSKAAQAATEYEASALATTFLEPLFHPASVPTFEQNTDTLNALLGLVSHCENLTEENCLVTSTGGLALRELEHSISHSNSHIAIVLAAVRENLTPEGRKALETLASISTALGGLSADPEAMAMSMVKMKRSECEVEQQLQRVETLHQQLKAEHARAEELLARLKGEEFKASQSLPQKTGEWTQGTKQLGMKMEEYKGRNRRLEKGLGSRKAMEIGIPELRAEEQEIRDLEARVSGLEGRVRGFEGLPPDKELALLEVEKMRKELETLARRRDAMFEGLVEGDN
ncbi:MAG: hypothetical protein LQ342_001408 [Letrouitia transgressa]|nr:MAG: hypothetical protein LQ342_001408 [Letrouitia transgressa]